MGVRRKDVAAVVSAQPDKWWQLSELLQLLGHRVSTTEAVARYRRIQKVTEETDRNVHPLDQKVRMGRRRCVTECLSAMIKEKMIIKEGGRQGATVRYKWNIDEVEDKESSMSKIGFTRLEVREFLAKDRDGKAVRLGDMVAHFLPRTNQEEAIRRWEYDNARLRSPRTKVRRRRKVREALIRHMQVEVAEILKPIGGHLQKPDPEASVVVMPARTLKKLRDGLV